MTDVLGPRIPDGEIPIVPMRKWGRWVSAGIILLLVIVFVMSMRHAQIAWGDIPKFFTYHTMIVGMYMTVLLAVVCQALGIVLGVIVAIMRRSSNPVIKWSAWFYIYIFRGLPALLQLYIWYNLALAFKTLGIPHLFSVSTNSVMTAFVVGVLGLGLNESAYYAEIVRAGFNSVDHGQIEAASSIGMKPSQAMRRVILPQAMRVIIPPTGNDFINMLKGTSLASVVGFHELILSSTDIYSANFRIMETLMAAALWYMVLVSLASIGQYFIEKKFATDRSDPSSMSMGKTVRRSLSMRGVFHLSERNPGVAL
ncbi:MAG: amino acid ABC transporter permease [Acidobacteria bacterium]|nr:amino acid ABC transporter permease [Acidobacteriota bacterium]